MPRLPTIRVLANPYAHLDHEGRPAGVVMLDPVEHAPYASDGEPRRFVGAAIDTEKTEVYQRAAESSAQSDLQETHWTFSNEVQELPRTHYYLDAIRNGELFAGDEETADQVGIPFVEPAKALEAAKTKALALWQAERPKRALPDWAKRQADTKREIKPLSHANDEVK